MTARTETAASAPDESPAATLLRGIERARKLTVWTLLALFIGTAGAWNSAPAIFRFIARPLTDALANRGLETRLVITALADPFVLYFTVSLLAGFAVALPILTFQAWVVLAPRLPRRGVVAATAFVSCGLLLFAAGAAFCQWVLLPFAIGYLLDVGAPFQQAITVREYLRFALRLIVALGFAAQLPLLTFTAARLGLVTPRALAKAFPYAILVAFVAAAWITPPDGMSQVLVAVPLLTLYAIGIAVSWLASRRR